MRARSLHLARIRWAEVERTGTRDHVACNTGPAPTAEPGQLNVPALIDDLLARGENGIHAQIMASVERVLFDRVLRATGGHLGRAAERLGLNRSTLRYKLRDTGLTTDKLSAD